MFGASTALGGLVKLSGVFENMAISLGEGYESSDVFLKASPGADRVTLGTLLQLLGRKSTSLVCLFLVSPFLQPVPLLGLSTPVGIIIALHGLAIALDQKPWIPRRLSLLTVPAPTIQKIASNLSRIFLKIEFLTSPRLTVFAVKPPFRYVNGFLLILAGLFLALPLPIPFSNGVPAILIFLVALSHAEEDGLLALVAYVYFIALIISGTLLSEALFKWIYSLSFMN